ncbi:MAG: hypothetical protein K2Y21_05990 [Phycisphaerales bacterium]|nr:hypothetical protein [Phycisphaerales bacterium]
MTGIVLLCAIGQAVSAQQIDQVLGPSPLGPSGPWLGTRTELDPERSQLASRYAPGVFEDRDTLTVVVYDCITNAFNYPGATLARCSHIAEDIAFTNGPFGPEFTGARVITGLNYAWGLQGGPAKWDVRFSFYRAADFNFAGFSGLGTGMLNTAALPLYTLTITGFDTNIFPGFVTRSGFFALPTSFTLPFGDTGVIVDAAFLEPGTSPTAPVTGSNLLQINKTDTRVVWFFGTNTGLQLGALTGPKTFAELAPIGNAASPGSTHPQYARDVDFSGTFGGQSLVYPINSPEERRYQNSTNLTLGFAFGLTGETDAPAVVPAVDLDSQNGFLADSITQVNNSLTSLQPYRVYKFVTRFPADYANITYLDIDTEGSSRPITFALYKPNSSVYQVAESRGSGPDLPPSSGNLNAFQMSFGVGRRTGPGNAAQYGGQEGDLPPGEYYLVVAPAGSTFGDAWTFNTAAVNGTTPFSLNIYSNTQKTTPAPAAAPPDLNPGADLGVLRGVSIASTTFNVRPRTVGWVRFTLANAIPTTNQISLKTGATLPAVNFLDITQPGSSLMGEWNFALYNSTGVLANASSISLAGASFNGNNGCADGPCGAQTTFAQLSYGTAASRGTPTPDVGLVAGKPLSNQNGPSLAADQYYLAVSLGQASFAPTRWGARSTRLSSLNARVTINSNTRGPAANCPADINGDQGVDDLDFALFAKFYNNLIDLSGDLNGDELTDDSDFIVFAQAYDALVCP